MNWFVHSSSVAGVAATAADKRPNEKNAIEKHCFARMRSNSKTETAESARASRAVFRALAENHERPGRCQRLRQRWNTRGLSACCPTSVFGLNVETRTSNKNTPEK